MRKLAPLEYACLAAYAEHGRSREAADALGIAPQTLKNYLLIARRKLGAVSTAQLLYRLGAGELDEWLPDDDE